MPRGWRYVQATGELFHDGVLVGRGYSGSGEGKNNPAFEEKRNVGPIPRGLWKIGKAYRSPKKGPVAMRLTPMGKTKTFGRAGFMIHGDSIQKPGSASDGCIVQGLAARGKIAASPDRELEVV